MVEVTFACIFQLILSRTFQILSLMDIVRIIKYGSVLPNTLWRARIETGKVISPEGERDMKLISLVLSFEYYVLLIFGVVMVSLSRRKTTRFTILFFF